MELFFCDSLASDPVVLGPEESWHLAKVLRMRVGETIALTDGQGGYGTGIVLAAEPQNTTVQLSEVHRRYGERPYRLHVAIAPTKNIDRLEWFLEKATEIGIDEITPVRCQRSERKEVRYDRLEKVIRAAVKQSLQAYVPALHPMVSLEHFAEAHREGQRFACITQQEPADGLQFLAAPGSSVTLVIGPEGDFTESETSLLLRRGFRGCSLGPHRLRTETAGVVGCHTIALINQQPQNA
jgi:16S rRNA (uracil1498-N3)-methyltransferase